MGNEPYAEWIKRDDQAQRLYKAYRDKWPDGDAQCVAIGGEFYVRFDNGEMRHVRNLADFDDEDEWCAQCGTPIDSDSSEYYSCDVYECDAVLCENCGDSQACDGYYCPRHLGNWTLLECKEDGYIYPYACDSRNMVDAWVESGYDGSVFAGQGLVALITPLGCLEWLEGEPVELSRGVWVSNMYWNVR